MIPVFGAAELVMEARERVFPSAPRYHLVTPAGEFVGSVRARREVLWGLTRTFTRLAGQRAARLVVLDAHGNHILDISKGRLGALGRLRVEVTLANGVPIGSVAGRLRLSRAILTLRDPGGVALAELHLSYAQRYELHDQQGHEIGRMSHRIMPATGAWRVYDISFDPSAAVAVRALSLASLVCMDLRLLF